MAKTMTGSVDWYNAWDGYGFIIRDDNGESIFVHGTYIQEKLHLKEGERVSFSEIQDYGGKPMAADVRRLKE